MPPRNVTLYVMVLSRHLSCGVIKSFATAERYKTNLRCSFSYRETIISDEIDLSFEEHWTPHEVNK